MTISTTGSVISTIVLSKTTRSIRHDQHHFQLETAMSSDHPIPRKLWQHADPKSTEMWRFMQRANQTRGLNMQASLSHSSFLSAVLGCDASKALVSQPLFITSSCGETSSLPLSALGHMSHQRLQMWWQWRILALMATWFLSTDCKVYCCRER